MLTAVVHISDINFRHDTDTDGVYIENEEILEIGLLSRHNLFQFLCGWDLLGIQPNVRFSACASLCVKTGYINNRQPSTGHYNT